ncbi:hypothetical protein [Hymenobacter terrenus]|uniref:hypothetical protein n=1 Tax=Hymenobacter terrenus TaxID=1629124 RepID=UPI0006198D74|nr:hypothetical protein [Hymenobacter terrenus]
MAPKSIRNIIPGSHSYHISKIFDGIHTGHPLAKLNLKTVRDYYAKVKEALDEKDPSWRDRQGLAGQVDEIDYALDRLSGWTEAGNLEGNRDASVFLDALGGYFEVFISMLDEVDAE